MCDEEEGSVLLIAVEIDSMHGKAYMCLENG